MLFLLAVYIVNCGLLCVVRGQILQISTKFMSGNVIFIWTPSNYSYYDVQLTTDRKSSPWTRAFHAQFNVSDALLNDFITINVRTPRSETNNRMTYKVSKVKTQTRSTETVSWTAVYFPQTGQYQVYHTYSDNRTIFSISRNGVSYGTKNISTKYTYITRPFSSKNITFEIRDISIDDAGYYNGGVTAEAAWSGGGVVLIVKNGPSKPKITGNLDVEVTKYMTLTCSSQSMSAPDYYSKIVTLSYTWFVNDTEMDRETRRKTLNVYVTRDLKYNRYSCTATEEDLESEKSDQVQINPLYKPDRLSISPQPTLNGNNKMVLKEGDTIGPFNCSADCNPACDVTWKLKRAGDFSDPPSMDGILLPIVVTKNMEFVRCVAQWRYNNETSKDGFGLDVQYLDNATFYINDGMNSNGEVNENTVLRIYCHVDGNPAPTIRLSRVQTDKEVLQRQGTWLNHTINTAQCVDTDTYKCSGTSTGFTNKEKAFKINVLCKTRFDSSVSFKSIYGSKSGMGAEVNVAVPIIANPPPQTSDFTWDGPVQVTVTTTISSGDVTYKHIIGNVIPVKDQKYFGNYTLKCKGETITRITINAEDVPQTPLNFTGYSYSIGSINLTWVSGFNGGPEQIFILSSMEGSTWSEIANISDPGEGKLVHFDPGFYTPGQEYSFRIYSCNRINCSSVPTDTKVTVKAITKSSSTINQGVTIGASLAGFVFIVLVAVLLAMYFLKKKKIEKKRASIKLDESRQPDVVLYASVDKSDQKKNKNNADVVKNEKDDSPESGGETYASVDKSLLKKNRKQLDTDKNEENEILYANSEEPKPTRKPSRGQKGKRSKTKEEGKAHGEKDSGAEYGNVESRRVNEDGLIYIDVDFSNNPGSQNTDQKPLIHGDEDRTEYTFVDFSKKAPSTQETGGAEKK